jgi:arylsulfatase A-like enzyme
MRGARTLFSRLLLGALLSVVVPVVVLGSCGGGCSDRSVPASALLRLAEAPGRLQTLPRPARETLLGIEFDALPADWNLITDQKNPLATDPDLLTRELGSEGGRTFLTLSGRGGALYKIVPVEPDTPYLFTGELRARGVVPKSEPFFGATFWLGELSASGSPRELFGQGADVGLRHSLPTAVGAEGWQSRLTAFRTRPETRTLIIGCVFAVNEDLETGAVDFDHLRLERIEERDLWEFRAVEAVAAAHRGDALAASAAAEWRARRSVGAMLGGEHRPAILCFPGERLELEVAVPAEDPVLELALAPWPEAFRPAPAANGGSEHELVFRVRAGGKELLREPLTLASSLGAMGWRPVTVELGALAGERVTLELALDGPLPGLFGGAVVRPRAAPAPEKRNVILVSIDTLRADRVGAYGAESGATPALDAFARSALVFADMTANAPYTLPAHATMFSGQFPEVHGVEDRGHVLAARRSPILARILAEHGWRTQAFVAGGFLATDFGLHAGFDGWSVIDPFRHPSSGYFDDVRRELPDQSVPALFAEPGLARVQRWIAEHADEPFFLFLHTYEVHDYDPPPGTVTCRAGGCTSELEDFRELMFPKQREPFPGTPEDRLHLEHLYDAALAHVDAQLATLLADLERLGLDERTLVVVTTDHGEEFFERGHLQHGKTLYDEMLRIPLVVRVPGMAPGRRTDPAMQVDLAPTLLGLLGLPPDPRMQGRDLLAAAVPPLPVFAEVDDFFARKASLRDGAWKLVHGPLDAEVSVKNTVEWQLFDLARDPGETHDLAEAEPERLERLRRQLLGFAEHLTERREQLGPLEDSEVDEATQRLLQQLGYVE